MDEAARSSFLFPLELTLPIGNKTSLDCDVDFRNYPKQEKELPDNLTVNGTVSFAESNIKVVGENSTFGEIITRNSNIAVIEKGCRAKDADFRDSPQLREVRDGYEFETLRVGRSPNVVFGVGKVGTLITADMTNEEFEKCANYKNIRYVNRFTETEFRRLTEKPAKAVTSHSSEAGRQTMLDRIRSTGTVYPQSSPR